MRAMIAGFLLIVIAASGRAALVTRTPWKNREVPYVIENVGSPQFVRDAIQVWNRALGVDILRPKQPTDTHWVVFRAGVNSGGTGCESDIGFDQNTNPHEIYTDSCAHFWEYIHEIGHVLGMEHEHQRCDTPEYLRLTRGARATIAEIPGLEPQYTPKPCLPDLVGSRLRVPSGPYDFLSRMHYPPVTDVVEDFCLMSGQCLRFTLTEKGARTLRAIGIHSVEDLAAERDRLDADCLANLRNCLTTQDVRAVKDLYGVP